MLASPGPIDEIVPLSPTAIPVLVQPILMGIARSPRPTTASVAAFMGNNDLCGLGATSPPERADHAAANKSVFPNLSLRGINGSAQSGGTEPTWPSVVGATVGDPSTSNPPNVIWQALLDPLSVDPDDPLGMITPGLISEPYETPNTWNSPLIVATATDLDTGDPKSTGFMFGLYEPYDAANFGTLAQPQPPQNGATDPSHYWRDALYTLITNHQQ